jgi:hypothetical protein
VVVTDSNHTSTTPQALTVAINDDGPAVTAQNLVLANLSHEVYVKEKEHESAEHDRDEKKVKYESAEHDRDEKKAKYEAAEHDRDEKKAKYESAELDRDEKKAKYESAEHDRQDKEHKYADAKENLKAKSEARDQENSSQDEDKKAKNERDLKAAKDDCDGQQKAYESAKDDSDKEKKAYESAKDDSDKKKTAYESANDDRDEKKTAYESSQHDTQESQLVYETAQHKCDSITVELEHMNHAMTGTASLGVKFGADGLGAAHIESVAVTVVGASGVPSAEHLVTGIDAAGHAVYVTSGGKYLAYVAAENGMQAVTVDENGVPSHTVVFTVSTDLNAASYTVTTLGAIDASDKQDVTLLYKLVATDAEGDTAQVAFHVTLNANSDGQPNAVSAAALHTIHDALNDVSVADNNTFVATEGSDVFKWSLADLGSAGHAAHDVVSDFSAGDKLDIKDILTGDGHHDLSSEIVGSNTHIHIADKNGHEVQEITLQGYHDAEGVARLMASLKSSGEGTA